MRSLRYRVVTLSTVLLALAAGILLGNGPLQGDDAAMAGADAADSEEALDAARRQVADERKNLAFAEGYAAATAPALVGDALAGRAVTLVVLPGASAASVQRVQTAVAQAGGTVAAQVGFNRALLDVGQRQLVAELARQLDVGRTERAVGVPDDAGDYTRVARLLAYALLTRTPGGEQQDRVAQDIMAGFSTAGLVRAQGDLLRRGSLALVLGGAPYGSADERDGAGSIVLELLDAFDRAGRGTVLAAPVAASREDGLVATLRRDAPSTRRISTVDVADQAAGAVVTVLALAAEAGGRSGDWGSAAAADGPLPPPAEARNRDRRADRSADRRSARDQAPGRRAARQKGKGNRR